ncbi:MAG: hypothetical protein ABI361_09020 [Nitrososphaera sp.]|jgi:hypothetical protein
MPLKEGSKNVPLRPALVLRLAERWNETKKVVPNTSQEFGGYVNELLTEVLDKDDMVRKMAPHLSLSAVSPAMLFIRDQRSGRTAEVYLHDQQLYCDLDRSKTCEHVQFAFAIPEVAKLQLKKPRG